jgi:hypothetical protein
MSYLVAQEGASHIESGVLWLDAQQPDPFMSESDGEYMWSLLEKPSARPVKSVTLYTTSTNVYFGDYARQAMPLPANVLVTLPIECLHELFFTGTGSLHFLIQFNG